MRTIATAALCALALASIDAQAPLSERRGVQARVEGVPRAFKTPWGDPDLQGTWSNQTLTPLERPAEFANKPVMSEPEAAEDEKRLLRNNDADVRNPGTRQDVNTAYNNVWWDRGNKIVADRRTSLIVDPADGKIPPLTPGGVQRAERERQLANSKVQKN